MTVYEDALVKLETNAPLSPLEYASVIVSATSTDQLKAPYTLDNSAVEWDAALAQGRTFMAWPDTSSKTLYVGHAAYVGAQQSGTFADLGLPQSAYDMLARALPGYDANPESYSGWALIIGGAALIAVGVATFFVPGLSEVSVAAGVFLLTAGVAAIALAATFAALTPTIVNKTCNSAGTSCCVDWTTEFGTGVGSTCTNCPSTQNCTAKTTPPPTPSPFSNPLVGWGVGIAVIGAAAVGTYAAYKYVANKPRPGYAPRPTAPYTAPPPPPPPNPSSFSYRAGAGLQRVGQRAGTELQKVGQRAVQAPRQFYQGLRGRSRPQ